ncbi:MAG: 5-oxoprolinase subunit PxpB [Phycisphaerales bacterium]
MHTVNDIGLEWISDRHLLLKFSHVQRDATTLQRVHAAAQSVNRAKIPGVLDVVPAEATVLIAFDARELEYERAASLVSRVLKKAVTDAPFATGRRVDIPVCYDSAFAPDLETIAAQLNLHARDVIQLHLSAEYVVKFVGFVPGFAYLSGLPTQLHVPRLNSPRPRVPAGSVAIAGDQAGVYPLEVPGGWRLIGRTPIAMFDASREQPSLLQHGDRVKFVEIGTNEFHRLTQHKERR